MYLIRCPVRYIFLSSFILYTLVLSAQEDTLYLEGVEIQGTLLKYTDGMMVDHLDSISKKIYEGNSLGQALQQNSRIYVRRYGAEGQLSTISFRGTTPSQTIVTWNGVDINSQTLGQSDFSSIPTFMFSGIDFYHGANSTLNGSGAVGGAIDLNSNALFTQGFNVYATQHVGSYGKSFSGIRASYGNEQWKAFAVGFYNRIRNDFEVSYRNTTYQQNNASSRLAGILTAIRYYLKPTRSITTEIWYNNHDREVQPVIGDFNGSDILLDKNLRANLTFSNAGKSGFLKAGLSFISDQQTFNNSSSTNLFRYRSDISYEYTKIAWWSAKSGGYVTLAMPEVSSYSARHRQWRGAIYLLNKFQPVQPLTFSLNIRQPMLEGIKGPLVPSLGLESMVINRKSSKHFLFASTSRSFRFPTLNDLFWQPGGNPDLKPEDGISIEAGHRFELKKEYFHFNTKLSAYQSWLSNMIVWVPKGSLWEPENIRDIGIKGVESTLAFKFLFSSGSWHTHFSYTLNQSQYQSNLSDTDRSKGNQLAYVPLHKGSVLSAFNFKNWVFTFRQAFTGMRYTESTNTSTIEGFTVADIGLGKKWNIKDHVFELGFEVNNLWDADYMNYELRATPGRNYLIKIDYQLNK